MTDEMAAKASRRASEAAFLSYATVAIEGFVDILLVCQDIKLTSWQV
jgi:hypothetical protein